MSAKVIHVPNALYRKLFRAKEEEGLGDKSIVEYLEYLTRSVHLNPTMSDDVREATKVLLPLWMNNFSNNLPYIRFGDNLLDLKVESYKSNNLADIAEQQIPDENNPPKGTAIVIGRGPSLFNHKHLELLAKSDYKGAIIASDGILLECLKYGIVPTLTTTVDGSPIIKKWYDHPLVKKHGEQLKIVLSATVNHEVYQMLRSYGCQIYWFYPMFDDWRNFHNFTKMQRLMTTSEYNNKPLQTITAGGNTGTCAWVMAMSLLKKAPIGLIGIDFGYPEGTKLETTPYYSSVMPYGAHAIPYVYKEFYHPFFKTKATADPPFIDYRETFLTMNKQTPPWYRYWGGTVNCSEGGTLYGEGISYMYFKDFLSRYPK